MSQDNIEDRDYFTDEDILKEPREYFRSCLARGPVYDVPGRDYMMVTGFREAIEVVRNHEDFSSIFCFSPYGAGLPLPFKPVGDDISEQVESCRTPDDLMVTYDGAFHSANRSILNKLFTPPRLKANEAFMREHADKLLTELVPSGACEFIDDFGLPFATGVIADLLGIPHEDRQLFLEAIAASPPIGSAVDPDDVKTQVPHFGYMSDFFEGYIRDRRANPKADVLHELATATYPDGSIPELMEIVKLAMFLFVGGRGSSSKFMATCLYFVAELPDVQRQLRENRKLIPAFIEEVLRLQGTTKATFRLAIRNTRIGDVEVPAGTKVAVAFEAANRDPARWENPDQFQLNRSGIREHVAFGRGVHTCAGAPLARAEARVVIERFFNHTSNISLNEQEHGEPGNRRMQFDPSYIARGFSSVHLLFVPDVGK